MIVGAAEQHRARGRTGGADTKLREPNADRRQGIEIWGLDLAAEAPDVGVAGIICHDQEDVGSTILRHR